MLFPQDITVATKQTSLLVAWLRGYGVGRAIFAVANRREQKANRFFALCLLTYTLAEIHFILDKQRETAEGNLGRKDTILAEEVTNI